jgi:glycosidase
LRSSNQALATHASFKKLSPEKDSALYAFVRESNKQKVFVVINASNQSRTFSWTEQTSLLLQKKFYVMGATLHNTKNKRSFELPAWGYAVYAQ